MILPFLRMGCFLLKCFAVMSVLPKSKRFVSHKAWKYSLCDPPGMVMNLKAAFFRK